MSTFVLIHGAWHGSWCWDRVVPLLETAGHKVIAVDLPGRDGNPPASEITAQTYADHVASILALEPEPVILVGHSLGGLTVTNTVELCPDDVALGVYLSAMLLRNGEVVYREEDVVEADEGVDLASLTYPAAGGAATTLKREPAIAALYNTCTSSDANAACDQLVAQPMAPLGEPVSITEARFGRVPRVFIACDRDVILPPDIQKSMYDATRCEKVFHLNTDHSPFLCAPRELADILLRLPTTEQQ